MGENWGFWMPRSLVGALAGDASSLHVAIQLSSTVSRTRAGQT